MSFDGGHTPVSGCSPQQLRGQDRSDRYEGDAGGLGDGCDDGLGLPLYLVHRLVQAVACLLGQGLQDKSIARDLKISDSSVHRRINEIITHLDVTNRLETSCQH